MSFTCRLAVALGLYLLVLRTRGVLFQYPDNFAHFHFTSSATDGNSLFLDSGAVTYAGSQQTLGTYALACTIYVDLTVPWNNNTVKFNYFRKPIHFPFSRTPVLWYNPKASQIQFFAGWWFDGYDYTEAWMCDGSHRARVVDHKIPDLPRPWMWSLSYADSSSGDIGWSPSTPQPGTNVQPMRGALTALSKDAVYSLGTWFETYVWSNEDPDSGLMIYDFTQQQWQNTSSAGYGYQGRGYAAMGRAEYTDVFGDSGVIVYLSGYAPAGQFYPEGGSDQGVFQSFAQLYIYDIASQTFFTQSTSGRIPDPRWAFCSVGVSEQNTHSFDIYIYGGFSGDGYDEPPHDSMQSVFVLSLPSFVWKEIPYSSAGMRGAHTCQVAGQRQMIVFGGSDPTVSEGVASIDPWVNAINVFDLSRWRWASEYNPHAAPYKKNPELAKSNAQTAYPKTWDSDLARAIFYPKEAANGRGSPVGPIAGGIVGAMVILVIIAAIVWFVRKRRRSTRSAAVVAAEEVEFSKPELDGHGSGSHGSGSYGSEDTKMLAAPSPLYEIDSSSPMPELAHNNDVHELDGGYNGWDSRST